MLSREMRRRVAFVEPREPINQGSLAKSRVLMRRPGPGPQATTGTDPGPAQGSGLREGPAAGAARPFFRRLDGSTRATKPTGIAGAFQIGLREAVLRP
jgi:hypothetical protein